MTATIINIKLLNNSNNKVTKKDWLEPKGLFKMNVIKKINYISKIVNN